MDTHWELHPTLAGDCHYLGTLNAAHLLLHRNAALHWFILVPETSELDLLDLPAAERNALMSDAAIISDFLKSELHYARVNVGALGLVVPQLHLHVVGRRDGDPCWPAPVWGNLDSGAAYSPDALSQLHAAILGP